MHCRCKIPHHLNAVCYIGSILFIYLFFWDRASTSGGCSWIANQTSGVCLASSLDCSRGFTLTWSQPMSTYYTKKEKKNHLREIKIINFMQAGLILLIEDRITFELRLWGYSRDGNLRSTKLPNSKENVEESLSWCRLSTSYPVKYSNFKPLSR